MECHQHLNFSALPPGTALSSATKCMKPDRPGSNPKQKYRGSATSGFIAVYSLLTSGRCQRVRLWGFVDNVTPSTPYHYFTGGESGTNRTDGEGSLKAKYDKVNTDVYAHDFRAEHELFLRASRPSSKRAKMQGWVRRAHTLASPTVLVPSAPLFTIRA